MSLTCHAPLERPRDVILMSPGAKRAAASSAPRRQSGSAHCSGACGWRVGNQTTQWCHNDAVTRGAALRQEEEADEDEIAIDRRKRLGARASGGGPAHP